MLKRILKIDVNFRGAFLPAGSSRAGIKAGIPDRELFSKLMQSFVSRHLHSRAVQLGLRRWLPVPRREWDPAGANNRFVTELKRDERNARGPSLAKDLLEVDDYDAIGNPYLSRQDHQLRIETANRQAINHVTFGYPGNVPET